MKKMNSVGCSTFFEFSWSVGSNYMHLSRCIHLGGFAWAHSLGLIHWSAYTWVYSYEVIHLGNSLGWNYLSHITCLHSLGRIPLVAFTSLYLFVLYSLVWIHLFAFTWWHSLGCIYIFAFAFLNLFVCNKLFVLPR